MRIDILGAWIAIILTLWGIWRLDAYFYPTGEDAGESATTDDRQTT